MRFNRSQFSDPVILVLSVPCVVAIMESDVTLAGTDSPFSEVGSGVLEG